MPKEEKLFVTCEKCGASVRDLNMLDHMAKAHNDQDAKGLIERGKELKNIFSKEMFEKYLDASISHTAFGSQKELKEQIESHAGRFEELANMAYKGLLSEGMAARLFGASDNKDFDIDQFEIPGEISFDDKKRFKEKMADIKRLKKDTLQDSLTAVVKEYANDDRKGDLLYAMFSLFPKFWAAVWDKTYAKRCPSCKMSEFKRNSCEKGTFWCIYDLDFNDLYEHICDNVIDAFFDNPNASLDDATEKAIHSFKEASSGTSIPVVQKSCSCELCNRTHLNCSKCNTLIKLEGEWIKEKDSFYRTHICPKCKTVQLEAKMGV